MAKSLLYRMLTKRVKIVKSWKNTYVLRQEFDRLRNRWFPVIFYWNVFEEKKQNGDHIFRCWVEGLTTDCANWPYRDEVKADEVKAKGGRFFHGVLKADYTAVSSPGTDRCDPAEVKRLVDGYLDLNSKRPVGPLVEVKKLGAYMPKLPF